MSSTGAVRSVFTSVLQQTEQDPEHHIEGRQRADALENLQVIRALGASEGSVSHNERAWRE